jgi:hypothetical protein
VQFDAAAMVGAGAGQKQCETVYARCRKQYAEMYEQFEDIVRQLQKEEKGNAAGQEKGVDGVD